MTDEMGTFAYLEGPSLDFYSEATNFENDDCECDDADIVYTEGGSVVCGC